MHVPSLLIMTEWWLPTGQLNLSKTSVLVVGCGGLGCPLALYLAAAGIGRLDTFHENESVFYIQAVFRRS